MAVTTEEVRKIADLAHLRFADEELDVFVAQFQRILDYFEQLESAPTEAVDPTYHALEEADPEAGLRSDEVRSSLDFQTAIEEAPQSGKGYFRVPKVIEET